MKTMKKQQETLTISNFCGTELEGNASFLIQGGPGIYTETFGQFYDH